MLDHRGSVLYGGISVARRYGYVHRTMQKQADSDEHHRRYRPASIGGNPVKIPRHIRIFILAAISVVARAEVFVAPVAGTLYVKCVDGVSGATSQFGTGTSVWTFVSYLSSLPQSCPTNEVTVGSVVAGQSVPFGIHSSWNGADYWAFSTETDQGSVVSFTDVNNNLGMGGKIIQPTGPNTWVMHLNDAARYTMGSDGANNNILVQLRLSPGTSSPPPPTGGVFVAPYAGTLYLTCIGGNAGTTSQSVSAVHRRHSCHTSVKHPNRVPHLKCLREM